MDYVVLARKLRPSRFQDLIGQETVARSLRNAVLGGRSAHAYLFAGSRGVGKTSTARILTKALNCLDLQEGEPCNKCTNCEEITHNASPDVLEIDAASNRGIDSIRELRENTRYTPAKCTYKTYIIDEVHMLTMESFNALLKTLEEPPPHVKFILATTAAHRIPETILSRCQRFDFPRIPVGIMQEYLGRVTANEGISLSPVALETIARNASGGMRDALTAVDQLVAFAGNSPSDEQVLGILGVMDTREVLNLLGSLLDKNLEQALEIFAAIVERGHDLTTLLEALLREVKDFTLYKSLGGKSTYFQDHPPTTVEFFSDRNGDVTLDELQQIFYLLLELEGQLKLSVQRWACFEMALVKACRVEPLVGVPELLAQVRGMMGGSPVGAKEGGLPARGEHRPSVETRPRGREGGSDTGGAGSGSSQGGSGQDGEAEGNPSLAHSAPALPSADAARAAQSDLRPVDPHIPEAPVFQRPAPSERPPPLAAADASSSAEPVNAPGSEGETASSPDAAAEDARGLGQMEEASGEAPPQVAEPPRKPSNSSVDGGAAADTSSLDASAPETGRPDSGVVDREMPEAAPSPDAAAEDARASTDPPFDQSLPCEDPRWLALVEAVKGTRRKLAADLRRVEVIAISDDEVRIVLPDSGIELGRVELELLREPLAEAFGAAFHLRIDHDSNKKAGHAHSLIGREEQIERARQDDEREAAISDEKVQRVMRAFPQGRVEEVIPPQPTQNRRDDV